MSEILVEQKVTTKVTPQLAAEMFCALDDNGQAEFFEECAKIHDRWQAEHDAKPEHQRGFFSSQWYAIGAKLKSKGTEHIASQTLMDMAAPLYVHTLDHVYDFYKNHVVKI